MDPFKLVSGALTWLVGLATYVYIAGALVMWVRLHEAGLPAMPVVTELPRTLLVGVGIVEVVGPALALAALAVAALWLQTGTWPHLPTKERLRAPTSRNAHRGLVAFVVAAGFVWWQSDSRVAVAFLVAGLITYVSAVQIATRVGQETLRSFEIYVLIVAVTALVGAAMRLALDATRRTLPNAVACVNDARKDTVVKRAYEGVLIGRSSDNVYLGDIVAKRIYVIPTSRIGEVQVGRARPGACQVPRAK